MKVKILSPCIDRKTHKQLKVGDIVVWNKKRYNEVKTQYPNLVEEVKDE